MTDHFVGRSQVGRSQDDRNFDPRVALFVDTPDWHARRLIAAFSARGVDLVPISLRNCGFSTEEGRIVVPGFERSLPRAAFVRCVPGGSFEQVTKRLGILHALQACGVFVANAAPAVERSVDKSMTSFCLARAGLPTPATWVYEDLAGAQDRVARECAVGHRLTLKPLFGSQGRGLRLVECPEDLPPADEVDGVYYLQRLIEPDAHGWRDWRVFVAGERVIAAMLRQGESWITNAKQGAHCEAAALHAPLPALALGAVRAVGAHYAGVDIIRDRAGRYLVLEVNSMPAWNALQSVHQIDVTAAISDAFLDALASHRPLARDRDLPKPLSGA